MTATDPQQAPAPIAAPRTPAPRDGHAPAGPDGSVHLPLTVHVCRNAGEFGGLAREWAGLYQRCHTATAFQSHAWLWSWWLSYGGRRGLRVVLVRRGGELVAAAPLMRVHRPLPALVPLGGAITDYTDVLLADAEAGVATALAAGVRRAARGAVVDLREVREGASAERLLACWRGTTRRLPDSVCLELPGLPMDGLIARVGSSRGQRIRASLRKLEAAGVEEREVPPHEVPSAIETMMRLHLLQWRGRGVTPEHERPRFARHLARAAAWMAADGAASVTEFRMDGRVVAANLTVLSPQLAGGYLFGADPVLRAAKVDVTTLLMRHGVGQSAGGGRATLSLLRGAEPHKFHWQPEHRTNQRLLMAGRASAPALLLRYGLARARAAAARSARLRRLRALLLSRTGRSSG
ncbi:Acetyltransferase involved in cellulose biosynthesis, CelD/BcsL family [Actinacidiphila rubida]|uniref:Acetyltransferase involved in cellulose biosynthesis, CelD/BcsL family n=1 Tax=Actinacidiphila rubida TaxID=310780 RepID=A0A1H8TPG4_9ACTN|nr:GNAT family N-acetyltransferase [Actinacidiphila rubida]SEO92716.1 Acetyltransferase involved in cellulose biosynthesis, CelD/BcsL family [Actinacidiphila rubida]